MAQSCYILNQVYIASTGFYINAMSVVLPQLAIERLVVLLVGFITINFVICVHLGGLGHLVNHAPVAMAIPV